MRRMISRREFERFQGTKYQALYNNYNGYTDNFPMSAKDINTNEEFAISDALVCFPTTIDTTPENAATIRRVEHLADTTNNTVTNSNDGPRNNTYTNSENAALIAALIRSVEHLAGSRNNTYTNSENAALIAALIRSVEYLADPRNNTYTNSNDGPPT